MLQAVERRLQVVCSSQGGPRPPTATNFADGISAPSVGIGYTRGDTIGTVESGGTFRRACVRVDRLARVAVSQGMGGIRSSHRIHAPKLYPAIKTPSYTQHFRKPSTSDSRPVRFTASYVELPYVYTKGESTPQ